MSQASARLEGVRVLVTRPRERAQDLCFLLEDEGAQVMALPVLELAPPADARPLQAAAEQIQRYAWVAFASPAAVHALVEAVRVAGTKDRLRRLSVASVGPATTRAAASLGLVPALEAEVKTGAGLAEALKSRLAAGDEVLLPAAEDGRRELEESLRASGIAVTRVAAYRSEGVALPAEALAEVRASPPHVALFASPRTVEAFLDATGEEGRGWLERAKLVAIGPTTSSALSARGLAVAVVAERPTSEGLVEAAFRAVRG